MPNIPEQIHWKPDTVAKLESLGPALSQKMLDNLNQGTTEWRDYKHREELAKLSKERFNACMQEALPFLDGKAEAEEGSFTITWGQPRQTLDQEALKAWLVARGVDAQLLADGFEACTKTGKRPEPYVKFNPSRKKKGGE